MHCDIHFDAENKRICRLGLSTHSGSCDRSDPDVAIKAYSIQCFAFLAVADLFILTSTQLLGKHSAVLQLVHEKSCPPSLSIARYSFIQLSELGYKERVKIPSFETASKGIRTRDPSIDSSRSTAELPRSPFHGTSHGVKDTGRDLSLL